MSTPVVDTPRDTVAETTLEVVFESKLGARFRIRHCRGPKELEQCVALQQESWGYPDREVVPRNIFVLAQALGGHVLGAWDDAGRLAGFAMAVAAHEAQPGGAAAQSFPTAPAAYLHSHMVAVRAEYRDRGLGFALKRAQREDALGRGITRMRWTFDPLVEKNAWFNLQKLGATARRYLPDFYGQIESALQGGLPTDRLLAEWDLRGERVCAALDEPTKPSTGDARQPAKRITLPGEPARWKAHGDRDRLLEVQRSLREQFADAFAQGLRLEGFCTTAGGGGDYLLFPQAQVFPQARDLP